MSATNTCSCIFHQINLSVSCILCLSNSVNTNFESVIIYVHWPFRDELQNHNYLHPNSYAHGSGFVERFARILQDSFTGTEAIMQRNLINSLRIVGMITPKISYQNCAHMCVQRQSFDNVMNNVSYVLRWSVVDILSIGQPISAISKPWQC